MFSSEKRHSILGTGWAFPPSFDFLNGSTEMVSEEQDIKESIEIILNTIPGERIMQPEFGCDLRRFVFEPISAALVSQLDNAVSRALLNFEPRIIFERTELTIENENEGQIMLSIYYTIIITNTRHNIVFPFYKLEGSNLPKEGTI